jgi:DNA-binding SARP family transcriptional activator
VSDESSPAVVVQLLGPPRWRGAAHAPQVLSRKDGALLALVALGEAPSREQVASMLWPDVPAKTRQASLRQRLFKLRKVAGRPVIAGGPMLGLAAGVAVDALAAELPEAGELLGGYDYGDLEALDRWVLTGRERLTRLRLEQQLAQAARLENEGALAAVIERCERIVAQAPWHEHAWRRLMRAHYLRGDRAAAVDVFERCERYVRGEQGSRPSDETLELLAAIERLQAPAPAVRRLPDFLQHPPVLVGREDLLGRMHAAWQAGHALLLVGEGGIGKSRLLGEFLRDRQGVAVHRARAGEGVSTYATAVLLLRQVLERWTPVLDDATRAELSRLLPGLGPAPLGEGRQALLWQACERLLQAAQACGLQAVVVDDLQHADEATLELLRWCAPSPALQGLRFAFASRAPEAGPLVRQLADWASDSSRIERLHVGALSEAQLRQWLASMPLSGALACTPRHVEALYRHAGGHPFFTLETLKAMALGAGRLDDEGPMPMTDSVKALLERQLQRLSPAARELCTVVALAGADWTPELAAPMLGRSVLALVPVWSELAAAHVMQGQGFAHDLVREAALGQVPASWRAGLHAQLAEAMASRAESDPARVAEHWWAAARWREAAQALLAAAQRTRQAGRLEAFETLLLRAAEAHGRAGDAESRFAALADAAAAAMKRSNADDAMARLQSLLPLATQAHQQARVALLQAEAAFNAADFARAFERGAQALALAAAGSEVAIDADILHGHVLAMDGRGEEGVRRLEHARDTAAARQLSDKEAAAWAGLAYALHAGARLGEALRAQQQAVALARQRRNRDELSHALANLASLAHEAGDVPQALARAVEADALFQAIGVQGVHKVWNSVTLARNAPAMGRFDLAVQALLPLDQGAAAAGPTGLAYVRLVHASTWLWLGRPADALGALPASGSDAGDAVQARAAALRTRLRRLLGEAAAVPEAAAVQAFQRVQASARDGAALAVEWADLLPATQALEGLARARRVALDRGAEGMARSLAVCEVERLLAHDPAAAAVQAATLWRELQGGPHGLHSMSYPPHAWGTLARALRGSDPQAARACRQRALDWIDAAVMPDTSPDTRATFLAGNPFHRALLGRGGGGRTRRRGDRA